MIESDWCALVELGVSFNVLFDRYCVAETLDLKGEVDFSVLGCEACNEGGTENLPGGVLVIRAPVVEPGERIQTHLGGSICESVLLGDIEKTETCGHGALKLFKVELSQAGSQGHTAFEGVTAGGILREAS